MQASEDELAAFGERRRREEERDAVAWLGGEYRRLGNSFDVFASYVGQLRSDHRADALADLARRVGHTIKGELAVLELLGHPFPIGDFAVKATKRSWPVRVLRWLFT